MEFTTTQRGFELIKFQDCYEHKCSIQKSSLATDDAIWIGIDDPEPKILHGDARMLGIPTEATCGWVPYPIPSCVSLSTRMHLTREQVAEMLPILQHFVDSGELPTKCLQE